jgi:hypothetical protein
MAKYILVYEIDDYPDFGGGTQVEFFEANAEQEMHKRVNELASTDERISIITAGFLQTEYEYKPVEIIKEYRPERK